MKKIQVELTSKELEAVVSSLLFTSSVSVIGTIDEQRQEQLVDLAEKLKENIPSIKLKFIEFIEEEQYEDNVSSRILESFKNNLCFTTFNNA